jgi:hypothetical protein
MLLQHFLFFLTQMKKNPLQEEQVQPATANAASGGKRQ